MYSSQATSKFLLQKRPFAFRHSMASVEHEGLHDPPRAEPDIELTIKRDRIPVLATSDNVVAPFFTLPQGNGILKVVQWDLEQNHGLGNSERFFAAQVHIPLIFLTTCCFFKRSSLPHQPHSCSREEATHVSF